VIDSTVAVLHKHLLPNLKSQTASWAGPLIMLVDPSLQTSDKVELKGYVSQQNKLFRECFALFQPVKIHVELFGEKLETAQLLYGVTNNKVYDSAEKMTIFKNSFELAKNKISELQET